MKRVKVFLFAGAVASLVAVQGLYAQDVCGTEEPLPPCNADFTLSIGVVETDAVGNVTAVSRGPCGQTMTGAPDSLWDDGTGGADRFFDEVAFQTPPDFLEIPNDRPGHTLSVTLRTENNDSTANTIADPNADPQPDKGPSGAQGWSYGIGSEGALEIVDVTTLVSRSCVGGRFARTVECRGAGDATAINQLTGPDLILPDGSTVDRACALPSPCPESNIGMVSAVVLAQTSRVELQPEGEEPIISFRVLGKFPAAEGATDTGRLFFTDTLVGEGQAVSTIVTFLGTTFSSKTEPPLVTEECEISFFAEPPPAVGNFIRCDPNDDGKNNIADAIWIVNDMFRGGPVNACLGANDCNDDGMKDLSDAMFAIMYQFQGGAAPTEPFPGCGRDDDADPDNCPQGSTSCPDDA